MYSGAKIPVAVPFTAGGNLKEPYIKSTDEYVRETPVTYIVESELVRLEGHPYMANSEKFKMNSPSRFTVVKLDLPDMNKLFLPPYQGKIGLDTEISVWKLVGVRVDLQGPLATATTGTLKGLQQATDAGFQLPGEAEDNTIYDADSAEVKPIAWGLEHKAVQMLTVGCEPLLGVYEDRAPKFNTSSSSTTDPGEINRHQVEVEDGMFHEFGFGNSMTGPDKGLQMDTTLMPVEYQFHNGPVLIPDKLAMDTDKTGDRCFFMWKKEASGVRHTRTVVGQKDGDGDGMPQALVTPTAGMMSNANDIFNKNYWLNKASGPNNCVLWGNMCYVTFVDNTRGFIHQLTTKAESGEEEKYDPTKFKFYLRHVKEFKVTLLVRLCKVKLEAKLITYLLQINASWLRNIGFNFETPGTQLHGQFRDVLAMPAPFGAEEEEEEQIKKQFIHIDCTGHAELVCSETSYHPLAQSYHAVVGVPPLKKAPATKRARKS